MPRHSDAPDQLLLKPDIWQGLVDAGLIYPDQSPNLYDWVHCDDLGDGCGARVEFFSPALHKVKGLEGHVLSMYFETKDFYEVYEEN